MGEEHLATWRSTEHIHARCCIRSAKKVWDGQIKDARAFYWRSQAFNSGALSIA